jgi:diamine N-acetyltransferase
MRQNDLLFISIMITINRASVTDAAMLSALAKNIYKEHYLHLWHPGGAEWYMNEYVYALEKIENDLADPLVEYYIASEGETPVGYMKLVLAASLQGNEAINALEVERIYLHKKITGKGAGRQLMELAQQRAQQLKKHTIFLKAMDSSAGAIAFYQKLGYAVCGSLQLPMPEFALMKEEYRGMVILSRKVD